MKQQIGGIEKQGVWRQHGRAGVHIQERFDEFGYRETHEEADNEGPLGAERLQNRRALLDRSMVAQRAAEAERTAVAPFQGLDALALIRSLGVVKGTVPASGQEQRPNEETSSESSGMEDDDAPQAVSYFQALVGASVPAPTPPPQQKAQVRRRLASQKVRPENRARLERALPSLCARRPWARPLLSRTSQRSPTAA